MNNASQIDINSLPLAYVQRQGHRHSPRQSYSQTPKKHSPQTVLKSTQQAAEKEGFVESLLWEFLQSQAHSTKSKESKRLKSLLGDLSRSGATDNVLWTLYAYKALLAYEKTGIVEDKLLPFFDQDGNWYGFGFAETEYGPIAKNKIDPKRTISKEGILLSSYVLDGDEKLSLDFKAIIGDLCAMSAQSVHLPQIQWIGGSCLCGGAKEFLAPELTRVLGSLGLDRSKKAELHELQSVGADLTAWSLHRLDAPKLKRVLGSLWLNQTEHTKLTSLEYVGKECHMGNLKDPSLPKLTHIGNEWNLDIKCLKNFQSQQLKKIGKATRNQEVQASIEKELQKRQMMDKLINNSKGTEIELSL